MPYADNPQLWRDRAEEARIQAEQMSDATAKTTMLGIAAGYDRMAERAEARIAGGRELRNGKTTRRPPRRNTP